MQQCCCSLWVGTDVYCNDDLFWGTKYPRFRALKIPALLSVLQDWQKYQHYNECNVSCSTVMWWEIGWQMNTRLEPTGALDAVAWHGWSVPAVTSFGLSTSNPCFPSSPMASSHISWWRRCICYLRQRFIIYLRTLCEMYLLWTHRLETLNAQMWGTG
jgi:hypothetical protein